MDNDNNNNINGDDDVGGDDDDSDDDTTDTIIHEIVFHFGYGYYDEDHEDESIRLIIDDSVHVIDSKAFYECESIVEVVFHPNLTRIERKAFSGCVNLRRIINGLPDGLISLGEYAFRGCSSLQGHITIPPTVQNVNIGCFQDCESLESVEFHPTAKIDFESCIFSYWFWGCKNLRSVKLPQNLRRIPVAFFKKCSSLKEIELPVSIQEIGYSAFERSGLRSIHLSENLIRIRSLAFLDCESLTTVTIRSSLNLRIERDIFANCPSLCAIKVYPWIWPRIFESMNDDLNRTFIMKFFKLYHKHIFDFQKLMMDRRRQQFLRIRIPQMRQQLLQLEQELRQLEQDE